MSIFRRILIKLFPQFMRSDDLVYKLTKSGVKVGKKTVFYYPNTITIDTQRPWMLSIGEYCKITGGTIILAHDYSRSVIRRRYGDILGEAGKTVIGNNVFIGMNSVILMGTKVGNNCIIGAGSIVKGTFPDDCVIAGNPAKVVCSLEEFYEKRKALQIDEVIEYSKNYFSNYGRIPLPNEYGPFFHLFLERDLEAIKKNNINLNWNGDEEDEILASFLNSEGLFKTYEDFIEYIKEQLK